MFVFVFIYTSIKQHCFFSLSMLMTTSFVPALLILNVYICIHLFFAARGYTSAYINPSLAYGLTFFCSGFTWAEYALVYWLGSFTGRWSYILIFLSLVKGNPRQCVFQVWLWHCSYIWAIFQGYSPGTCFILKSHVSEYQKETKEKKRKCEMWNYSFFCHVSAFYKNKL